MPTGVPIRPNLMAEVHEKLWTAAPSTNRDTFPPYMLAITSSHPSTLLTTNIHPTPPCPIPSHPLLSHPQEPTLSLSPSWNIRVDSLESKFYCLQEIDLIGEDRLKVKGIREPVQYWYISIADLMWLEWLLTNLLSLGDYICSDPNV